MEANNIILVGMMGAGKSSVANELGNIVTSYRVVDVDEYIERNEGIIISEIFERFGEKGFRKLESCAIEKLASQSGLIISTGGGAFEYEENRKVLLKSGKVFYLYAPSQVLYDRIKTQGNRPLLNCENPKEVFDELLDKRDKNYRKADYTIDTSSLTPELVAKEILRSLNETFDISSNTTGQS